MEDIKYPLSTLGKQEYLYTFDDNTLTPLQVIFRSLSQRELNFIRNLPKKENQTVVFILEKGIVQGIHPNINTPKELIDVLRIEQKKTLARCIMQVSSMTDEMIDKISFNTIIAMDERFHTETWDCSVCKKKGLDTRRNCKFREDYDTVFDPTFVLLISGEEYRDCPMYYRDPKVTQDTFQAYKMYDKGILPDEGGALDQTEFFNYAWNIVLQKKNEKEAEALEKE